MVSLPFLTALTVEANGMPVKQVPDSIGLYMPSNTSQVRIDREKLSFNLASGNKDVAEVKASYELSNLVASDVDLDVLFVAPEGRDPSVTLDGVAIPTGAMTHPSLPEEWINAGVGVDPRTGEVYKRDASRTVRIGAREDPITVFPFKLRLPPNGKGVLTVDYSHRLYQDRQRADHIVRQLVYVLGPAKHWAGFGTLEVSATVPANYIMASSPPLKGLEERQGVVQYGASFEGIPGNLLLLSTMLKPSPLGQFAVPVEYIFPLVIAAVAGVAIGRLLGFMPWWWLAGLSAGIVALVVTPFASFELHKLLLDSDPITGVLDDLSNPIGALGGLLGGMVVYVGLAPLLAATIAAVMATLTSRRRRSRIPPS